MSSDEQALLAAVCAAPDDDLPRLVYADWLDEHGEPERAEFIRIGCELARMPELIDVEQSCTELEWAAIHPHHPKYTYELTDPKNRVGVMRFKAMNPALGALRERERELLRQGGNWLMWAGAVLSRWRCGNLWPTDASDMSRIEFRRGFVEVVTCPAADWLAHADAILQAQPVRKVRLTTDPGFDRLLVGFTDGENYYPVGIGDGEFHIRFKSGPWGDVSQVIDGSGRRFTCTRYPGVEFELADCSVGPTFMTMQRTDAPGPAVRWGLPDLT